MLKFARSLGAAFALVLLGALAGVLATPTTLPLPSIPGPFLGDFGNNLYTISQQYLAGQGHGALDLGSVSQTSGQANCTQIGVRGANDSMLFRVTTSAAAGYVCLPTAVAGRVVFISNATGQTINLYSNAVSFLTGTADTINTVAGTTLYAGLVTHATSICAAPVNGAWFCHTGA